MIDDHKEAVRLVEPCRALCRAVTRYKGDGKIASENERIALAILRLAITGSSNHVRSEAP